MSKYYQGNKLYEYLDEPFNKHFYWASKDKWILLYSDTNNNPVLICGLSEYNNIYLSKEECDLFKVAKMLSDISRIPFIIARYEGNTPFKKINYYDDIDKKFKEIDTGSYKLILKEKGVGVIDGNTVKSVNDKVSSSYHEWQRSVLGKSVTVVDIDLIRFYKQKINIIYELKRSKLNLNNWEPFKEDLPNFVLLSRFAKMADIDFIILYNELSSENAQGERIENIEKLKLFSFDEGTSSFHELGIISKDDFINNL